MTHSLLHYLICHTCKYPGANDTSILGLLETWWCGLRSTSGEYTVGLVPSKGDEVGTGSANLALLPAVARWDYQRRDGQMMIKIGV